MYREGATSYLDVLMGSNSFDDFASTWDMLDQLNAEDASLVDDAKATKAQLDAAKAELDANEQAAQAELDTQADLKASIEAQEAAYQAEYNSLSSEYQQLIAQEREAESRRRQQHPPLTRPPCRVLPRHRRLPRAVVIARARASPRMDRSSTMRHHAWDAPTSGVRRDPTPLTVLASPCGAIAKLASAYPTMTGRSTPQLARVSIHAMPRPATSSGVRAMSLSPPAAPTTFTRRIREPS